MDGLNQCLGFSEFLKLTNVGPGRINSSSCILLTLSNYLIFKKFHI